MLQSIFLSITVILVLFYIFLFYLFLPVWRFSKKVEDVIYLYYSYIEIKELMCDEGEIIEMLEGKLKILIKDSLKEYQKIKLEKIKKICDLYIKEITKIEKAIEG